MYRASLPCGTPVAIKRFHTQAGAGGADSWQTELQLLSATNHSSMSFPSASHTARTRITSEMRSKPCRSSSAWNALTKSVSRPRSRTPVTDCRWRVSSRPTAVSRSA